MEHMSINDLKNRIRDFAEAREWDQLTCMDALMPRAHGSVGVAHSPKNLSMALSAEVAEIIEHFQWLTEEQSENLLQDKHAEVETEPADVFIYLIRLADKLVIDLLKAAQSKIEVNEREYTVDKAKGDAKKYTELAT